MKALDHQFTQQEKTLLNLILDDYLQVIHENRYQNPVSTTKKFCLECIPLPNTEGFDFVNIHDVSYLEAESNYTWIILKSGVKHLVSRTLKEMSTLLQFPQFFRAHKSYLVNLNHVVKYIRGQGGYLVLQNMIQIPVSRSSKEELMRILHI